MAQRSIGNKALGIVGSLAAKIGFDESDVQDELTSFVILSTRVLFDKNDIDFSLIVPTDSAEDIETKFLAYLDSAHYDDKVLRAWELIVEHDKPAIEALGPTPPDAESDDPKAES